ncbi:MAG: membrane associated rhomboid family serine protease [Patescibacteria group bacterium]|jgi:membrane associated rhomboid family serine protease
MSQTYQATLLDRIRLPLYFLALIWSIHLMQYTMDWNLGYLGVYPRTLPGTKGILLAPLIHADFKHLINNSIPFFVLGSIMLYFYPKVAVNGFIRIYFFTGLMVWLIGNFFFCGLEYGHRCNSYHIGASGVVYGLATFIMGTGIFRRNIKSIVLALIVLFYYSGMFMGILPREEGVSWESHLYGGIIGLLVAWYYRHDWETDEVPTPPSWANEAPPEGEYFLPRDVFEMTKWERRQGGSGKPDGFTSTRR